VETESTPVNTMKYLTSLLLLLILLSSAACKEDESGITVMTRNVYVGGNVDRIIEAQSIEQIPLMVLLTWQEIVANDFSSRAQALADEIVQEKPDLIGLQEISTLRTQTPGDFALGGTAPAEDIAYDFLDILLDALDERGQNYKIVRMVQNADAEMPMVISESPLAFTDVRLNDYDVVLARADVTIQNVTARNYDQALEVDFGGGVTLRIPRGYVMVDAVVDGTPVRFINTHFEPVTGPDLLPLQQAQAQELIESAGNGSVIVVGDLNSGPGDPTYDLLANAGFSDAWSDEKPGVAGLTCCYAPNLKPGAQQLDTRYDLVLYRAGSGVSLSTESATILGVAVSSQAGGIFPSDHAGVSVDFRAN
jgi:endonuclease/exonuclease/phosphatase family metal-dependent hydrolase